jgi:hypothetical protein
MNYTRKLSTVTLLLQFAVLACIIIGTDCRKKRDTCQSTLVDDFTSGRSLNSLGGDTSSDGTMTETRYPDHLDLTVLSTDSYFYSVTKLSTCLDLSSSALTYLHLGFNGSLLSTNFRVGLQVGDSSCTTRTGTYYQSANDAVLVNSVNGTDLYFDLSLFYGLTSASRSQAWAVELSAFQTVSQTLSLNLIEVVSSACLPSSVQVNTSSPALVIDYFNNPTRFYNSQNVLGGYASDDNTCSVSLTTDGLNVQNLSGCYYYTLFPSCYSLNLTNQLKLTYVDNLNSGLYFNVALQDRESTCTTRSGTYSLNTSAYNPTALPYNTYTVTFPLTDYATLGASLDRLHGIVLSSFNSSTVLKSVEVLLT